MSYYPDLELMDYGFCYSKDNNYPQDDMNWFLLKKIKMVLKHCINCLFQRQNLIYHLMKKACVAHVRLQLIRTKILIGKRERKNF